jgi:hypothetical protein
VATSAQLCNAHAARNSGCGQARPRDIPAPHWPWLQQLGGHDIGGVTRDGTCSSPGNPAAPDDDRQRQRPAGPPAVGPRLPPGRFSGKRGMRDVPGQPMLLGQPPPVARRGVLSTAAAWPYAAQGCRSVTRWRPSQPISVGHRAGRVANRRSPVRRMGHRPCAVSKGRRWWATGSACSRKLRQA